MKEYSQQQTTSAHPKPSWVLATNLKTVYLYCEKKGK